MKYKIEVTLTAQKDLHEIMEYITLKLYNLDAARRQVKLIRVAIDHAAENPYMYPVYYPEETLKHDYRKLPVDRYLVFYWVDEERKTITVARVLYGRRNYQTTGGGSSYLSEPLMKWKFDTSLNDVSVGATDLKNVVPSDALSDAPENS